MLDRAWTAGPAPPALPAPRRREPAARPSARPARTRSTRRGRGRTRCRWSGRRPPSRPWRSAPTRRCPGRGEPPPTSTCSPSPETASKTRSPCSRPAGRSSWPWRRRSRAPCRPPTGAGAGVPARSRRRRRRWPRHRHRSLVSGLLTLGRSGRGRSSARRRSGRGACQDQGAQAGDVRGGEAVPGGADASAVRPGHPDVLTLREELHRWRRVVQDRSGSLGLVAAHGDHRREPPGEALHRRLCAEATITSPEEGVIGHLAQRLDELLRVVDRLMLITSKPCSSPSAARPATRHPFPRSPLPTPARCRARSPGVMPDDARAGGAMPAAVGGSPVPPGGLPRARTTSWDPCTGPSSGGRARPESTTQTRTPRPVSRPATPTRGRHGRRRRRRTGMSSGPAPSRQVRSGRTGRGHRRTAGGWPWAVEPDPAAAWPRTGRRRRARPTRCAFRSNAAGPTVPRAGRPGLPGPAAPARDPVRPPRPRWANPSGQPPRRPGPRAPRPAQRTAQRLDPGVHAELIRCLGRCRFGGGFGRCGPDGARRRRSAPNTRARSAPGPGPGHGRQQADLPEPVAGPATPGAAVPRPGPARLRARRRSPRTAA